MNIFVIGATGFVGGHLSRHLAAEGHTVCGLARTETAAAVLEARGIVPVAGDLDARRPAVVEAALNADAVVYAAQAAPEQETGAVSDLVRTLAGTGRTLVFLSGSGVLLQRTAGAWSPDVFAEHDPFTVEPLAELRKATEDIVLAAAGEGLRAMVVRPGLIWGPGDHGHLSMVYRSVARSGAACYVGQGLNTYGHVHIDDVTRLFALALDKGPCLPHLTPPRPPPCLTPRPAPLPLPSPGPKQEAAPVRHGFSTGGCASARSPSSGASASCSSRWVRTVTRPSR
ncbi:NAD-dependent epimerase/dehydratase family protein [Streptomyces apricus]|uniref:NAD-dependent epimerase/dehydratase family protein n=1 Tax=Streptomyces apricus TaxID=1828112 RepID=A0A5B0BF00_9ACTN|nr:NAD-dependent epimerase/dehydratase family protein [Streptomyces apricus]